MKISENHKKKQTENTRTSPFVDGSQWVPNPGRKVLDLGCGLGIAGIVAAGLGAEVLLQDRALVGLGRMEPGSSRKMMKIFGISSRLF